MNAEQMIAAAHEAPHLKCKQGNVEVRLLRVGTALRANFYLDGKRTSRHNAMRKLVAVAPCVQIDFCTTGIQPGNRYGWECLVTNLPTNVDIPMLELPAEWDISTLYIQRRRNPNREVFLSRKGTILLKVLCSAKNWLDTSGEFETQKVLNMVRNHFVDFHNKYKEQQRG